VNPGQFAGSICAGVRFAADRSCATTVIAICLLSSAIGCAEKRAPANSIPPRVLLLDLNGETFDFRQREQGHCAVVVFTRVDCPISNRMAPEISRVFERFHPRDVDFYLIYVDPRESAGSIRQHLQEYHYSLPALRDPRHELVAYCNATVTPEAAVFGKDGAITYCGRITDQYAELGNPQPEPRTHDLADAIAATLAGQPVATPRSKAVGCSIADLKE